MGLVTVGPPLEFIENLRASFGLEIFVETGTNLDNFILITKKINGGTNGLHDRLNRYKNGVKIF